jgi:hypothetical protein
MADAPRPRIGPRPLTPEELVLVTWLVENAEPRGRLERLADSIQRIKVVSKCGCGCASVDFERTSALGTRQSLVEAVGEAVTGEALLVILWGNDEELGGLDVMDLAGSNLNALPVPGSLKIG